MGKTVIRCACGREQVVVPITEPGGITELDAQRVGWRRVNGEWRCPLCTDTGPMKMGPVQMRRKKP